MVDSQRFSLFLKRRAVWLGVGLFSGVTACGAGGGDGNDGPAGGGNAGTGASANAGGQSNTGTSEGGSSSGGTFNGSGAVSETSGGNAGTSGSGGQPGLGGSVSAGGAIGAGGNGGQGSGGASTGGSGGQVGLPPGVTSLFPPPNGTGLCPDPPFRLGFSAPPSLGTSGKIQVFNATGSAVGSIDMAAANITSTIGGTTFTLLRRAFVEGNEAVVYLNTSALPYGQTYYVTVDAGAIEPPGGGTFSISGTTGWRFSTASAAPSDMASTVVAFDGSGAFCSVQGATDALPANNSKAALITIKQGTYHEVVHVRGKNNITLHGQDRKLTVIEGTNNNNLNPSTATRSLVGFDAMKGLVVENLTIHNVTPQGGSQAEALRLQTCDQCVVRNADISSLQDTLLWSGRVYADNCYIAGNVDYIWGTGVAYFNQCEIHTVGRTGVIVQSRNAPGAYGYVFVDSKLTADATATNDVLARIDASAYPGSHVAYIDCEMTNISASGWTITGGLPSSGLRFWEYQSKDAAGNPLNVGGRLAGSTQISSTQAAQMRDRATVLYGWTPP